MDDIGLDLVILGGGVAGLWTLNRAVQAGHNAILLERDRLGGAQTIRSQGIIHGGVKYALDGVLTTASNTIREMPAIWRACLDGSGRVDLCGVNILSNAHYLWSKKSLGGRMAAFFASHALRDRISDVPFHARPGVFQDNRFHGAIYRLNELVLDVESLIKVLSRPVIGRIFQAKPDEYQFDVREGRVMGLGFPAYDFTIRPKWIVICCGEGYEALAKRLSLSSPRMQRRPLHMVMVKFPQQTRLPLYAHCLSGGARPLVTITTHYGKDHGAIWYLGGEIAESGTKRDEKRQIEKAKSTLGELLPWVDLRGTRWTTLRVDRAEPGQSTLRLPDSAFVEQHKNIIIAWPTKLALAPDLAEKVMAYPASAEGLCPPSPPTLLAALPAPAIAEAVWDGDLFDT
ncbi:MAG: Glycerol-3-phosphate dehydrogenase [Candidatus Kentron sp. G]|nr:MAG: Glycerol-3-phosphate dehydrogenase [Candidatus Kentron sp. G]